MINVQPVIMAGGSGTRLWPLSRSGFPKQFPDALGGTDGFLQLAVKLGKLAHQIGRAHV